jgi:hypothetical protein
MTEKFLKARIPMALYDELLVRAAEEGKRLSTYTRDLLRQHLEAMSVAAALVRIEAAIGAQAAAVNATATASADHGMRPLLLEVLLLVRELAMQSNAQIVSRVVAQLAAQAKEAEQ